MLSVWTVINTIILPTIYVTFAILIITFSSCSSYRNDPNSTWDSQKAIITSSEILYVQRSKGSGYCVRVEVVPIDKQTAKPLEVLTMDGCSAEKYIAASKLNKYPIGKAIEIQISPHNKSHIVEKGYSSSLWIAFLLLGIAVSILLLFVVISTKRKNST